LPSINSAIHTVMTKKKLRTTLEPSTTLIRILIQGA